VASDFVALAQIATVPPGRFHVVVSARPPESTDFGACQWYRIERAQRSDDICWSTHWRVPLRIEAQLGTGPQTVVFAVEEVSQLHDLRPLEPDTSGFYDIDGDRDLGAEED
jgi:hypothetical protein